MLKDLDPLLNADLLHVLRSMGHGDDLVIVDANFPAVSMGRRVVAMDGVSATRYSLFFTSVGTEILIELPSLRLPSGERFRFRRWGG